MTFSSFARSLDASASRLKPKTRLFRRKPPQPLTRVQHIIDAFQGSIIDAIVNLFQVLDISRFKTTFALLSHATPPTPPQISDPHEREKLQRVVHNL